MVSEIHLFVGEDMGLEKEGGGENDSVSIPQSFLFPPSFSLFYYFFMEGKTISKPIIYACDH